MKRAFEASGRISFTERLTAHMGSAAAIGWLARLRSTIESAARPIADRASATDLAFLSMDVGHMPEQFAAVLVLDPSPLPLDISRAEMVIAERVPAIPRLRQRLIRTPFGCGDPVWIDDAEFDIRRHVRHVTCRRPHDERALLDTVIEVVIDPLPRSRPLWSAVFVTGLSGDAVALVVVLHHVLADGIGGLAVLANLADHAGARQTGVFPRSRPSNGRLAVDAFLTRVRALGHLRATWRDLRASMVASGGVAPPRAAPCSLVQRTGPHRRLAVVNTDLTALRKAAHQYGATVNDAVLTAVAGALHRVLMARGESVDTITMAVPVAGRRSASAAHLGNQVAPMLVTVSATGDPLQRLQRVAAVVRVTKPSAGRPPPIAMIGPLFRVGAALGGYQWYMNHQHRLHTLVSHVRGPDQPITFAGATVRAAIPVAIGETGNITVSFEVLSYARTLTITAVADRDHFPDLATLTDGLRAELAQLTAGHA